MRSSDSRLLRYIAHDIASPAGIALMLVEEFATAAVPRADLVAMGRRSLGRLMRLSEQIAILAELNDDAFRLTLCEVDARLLARRSLEDARAIDGCTRVQTSLSEPSDETRVRVDVRLVRFVFSALISQALKLARSRVVVRLTADTREVSLLVEDDGPGLAIDTAARVERDRELVTRFSERDLTVAMARDILHAHDGSCSIETSSLPADRHGRRGAAIRLILPFARGLVTAADDVGASLAAENADPEAALRARDGAFPRGR